MSQRKRCGVPLFYPDLNVTMDWWNHTHTPSSGAPDVSGEPCQLYIATRPSPALYPDGTSPIYYMQPVIIRVASTFVVLRALYQSYAGILAPATGITWYYRIRWWEYAHFGFPNEYVQLFCSQCTNHGAEPDNFR